MRKTTATTTTVRAKLSEYIRRVQPGNERIVIMHHGEPVAAMINVDDLRKLNEAGRPEKQPEDATS